METKTDKKIEVIEKARMTFEALKKEYPAIMHSSDVARLLGTKESTIRQWTRKGKIPCRKMGGFVRYMLADLAFWLVEGGAGMEEEGKEKRRRGRPTKEEMLRKQGLI